MKHIGTIIRKERGVFCQAKVAQGAGLAREYVSRIEKGKIQPTLPTLLKIANGLDCQLWELVKAWEEQLLD